MQKEFQFKSGEILSQIKNCSKNGITELCVRDESFSGSKKNLLKLVSAVQKDAPDLFVMIKVDPFIIDQELCASFLNINCSLELDFDLTEKGFDKKLYAKKCALLNNSGLVFGVNLYFAKKPNDSLKAFKERLNFTINQIPNHIDFPQTENQDEEKTGKVSSTFSAQDIRTARDISFAARTFYSAGRAVTWFNSLLNALKILPDAFFADFAEWQKVNNCDYKAGFVPENENHLSIEKMQLLFTELKLDEKNKSSLFSAIRDIIKVNGAISRLVQEGEESTVQTEYNPEDLLGPESLNLQLFVNDVCMENCNTKFFINSQGEIDFKY